MSEETDQISDGYHTFDELYEHRHALFGIVCKLHNGWKSKLHNDGSFFDDWFIAGCNLEDKQITYHLPLIFFDSFPAKKLKRAPVWNGHTSNDVIDILKDNWNKPLNRFWWKKKNRKIKTEEVEEEIIYFPKENLKKLYFLYDDMKKNKNQQSKYFLWEYIFETLDLSKQSSHTLNIENVINPYVIIR